MKKKNLQRSVTDTPDAHDHEDIKFAEGPTTEVVFHSEEEEAHKGEDLVAKEIAKEVRILCWIMTGPQNHQSKVNIIEKLIDANTRVVGTTCESNLGKKV